MTHKIATRKKLTPESIIQFMEYSIKLKSVPRAGWILKGIDNPESVSEHSHSTGMLALALAKEEGLDVRNVALTAFLHDIGEAIVGDIIWEQGTISNKKKQSEKHLSETESVKKIIGELGDDELHECLIDFLEQRTPEARLVKDCDKLEMVFQAFTYEEQVSDPNILLEFWENAAKHLKSDAAWGVFEVLKTKSKITHPLPSRPVR